MTGRTSVLVGKRVAVVNWRDPWHSLAGGSERYAWEFARAMLEAGAEVEFWTARDDHQSSDEQIDGIVVRRRGGTFGFYPSVWGRFLKARFRRAERLDVVIDAENGIPVFAPLAVGRRTRVLLVMHHVHQEQFRTYFRRPVSDVGRFLEGWLMPRVYRNVRTLAVSESTLTEMRRQIRWERPVVIVPNGADQAGTAGDHTVTDQLLVLGRLATHKRIDAVIRAVAQLVAERPGLRLDIVGQGPERDRLVAVIDELRLGDRVRLHGFLPDQHKSRLLSEARLHLCASDAEGWGQVVVEAASYGLPTLARDVPGLRDSIRDGVTGWLVEDPAHPDEQLVARLVAGIRRALAHLDDAPQRTETAAACRAWAGNFTWVEMRRSVQALVAEELDRGH